MKRLMLIAAACGLVVLAAVPARAQLNGSHSLGDFGVQSELQPCWASTRRFSIFATTPTPSRMPRHHRPPRTQFARPASALGRCANFLVSEQGEDLWRELRRDARASLGQRGAEAPAFVLEDTIDTSFADTLVRPLDLGWHTARADITAGFQLYLPREYERGGSDNFGKGVDLRAVPRDHGHFDEKRTVSLATTAFWEFYGKKKDTDTKVGQILSLQGGLGKLSLGGGLVIGAAYYAHGSLRGLTGRVRPARWNGTRRRLSPQAQGVWLRTGRDAADGEQVEAVRPPQHPLSLGNRRTGENRRGDAGRRRDLPGSELTLQ